MVRSEQPGTVGSPLNSRACGTAYLTAPHSAAARRSCTRPRGPGSHCNMFTEQFGPQLMIIATKGDREFTALAAPASGESERQKGRVNDPLPRPYFKHCDHPSALQRSELKPLRYMLGSATDGVGCSVAVPVRSLFHHNVSMPRGKGASQHRAFGGFRPGGVR